MLLKEFSIDEGSFCVAIVILYHMMIKPTVLLATGWDKIESDGAGGRTSFKSNPGTTIQTLRIDAEVDTSFFNVLAVLCAISLHVFVVLCCLFAFHIFQKSEWKSICSIIGFHVLWGSV